MYIRKCPGTVSQLTTDNFNQALHLSPGKMQTVYFGPAKHFRRIEDREILERVRRRYDLPGRFVLTLSGYDRGKRKNIDGIIEAFRRFHGRTAHKLVIGGKNCHKFKADYGVPEDGYGRDTSSDGWSRKTCRRSAHLADLTSIPPTSRPSPSL
jgi:hypothetical protein